MADVREFPLADKYLIGYVAGVLQKKMQGSTGELIKLAEQNLLDGVKVRVLAIADDLVRGFYFHVDSNVESWPRYALLDYSAKAEGTSKQHAEDITRLEGTGIYGSILGLRASLNKKGVEFNVWKISVEPLEELIVQQVAGMLS